MTTALDSFRDPPLEVDPLIFGGPFTGGFTGGPPCNPQVDDIAGNNAYFNALCVGGVVLGPNPSIGQQQVYGVVNNPSTNSVSPTFVDMPDMTITFTLSVRSNVMAQFTGVFSVSLASTVFSTQFNVDGVAQAIGTNLYNFPTASTADTATTFLAVANMLPGTHTIKMQWAVNQGVVTGSGTTRQLAIQTFPNP